MSELDGLRGGDAQGQACAYAHRFRNTAPGFYSIGRFTYTRIETCFPGTSQPAVGVFASWLPYIGPGERACDRES